MTLSLGQTAAVRQGIEFLAAKLGGRRIRIMEVCGTHTMAIFRSGLRSLLPDNIQLLSGPGCPVCVTPGGYMDAAIELAGRPGVMVATFGDMVKVPGTRGSLEHAKAKGADVRMVYSPTDALRLARDHAQAEVVFLGIGFETTAPLSAAAILEAEAEGLGNFSVLSAHKLVPPALAALCAAGDLAIDAFMLPGHVSAIIGASPYEFIAATHGRPCVIAGFEPTDVLAAVLMLLMQLAKGEATVGIQYSRVVDPDGNPQATAEMAQVFEPTDAAWRGLGELPASGLRIRGAFRGHDAAEKFGVACGTAPEPAGCICGDVISGRATPGDCSLFGRACTPSSPVGPCMVSSEGTCSAHFRYGPRAERA